MSVWSMKRMTIDNVAELAFVSRSVVSRVLNNHPNVSSEARARVLRVIREHNYSPNSIARSLVTDRTHEVCLLAPRWPRGSIFSGIWPLLHFAISERCIERGYTLNFALISADMTAVDREHILRGHAYDGCILLTQEASRMLLPALKEIGTPTVCIGHDPLHPDVSSVDVDNYEGAYRAASHLLGLGHQHIGIVLGNEDLPETGERLSGVRSAFNDAGLELRTDLVAIGDYSPGVGHSITRDMINRHPNLTAIFYASDSMATGGMLALAASGRSIPNDVAVVGFDDTPGAAYAIPPLTTVHQPIFEKGEAAANILFDEIENNLAEPVHIDLTPHLLIRESCGASRFASTPWN